MSIWTEINDMKRRIEKLERRMSLVITCGFIMIMVLLGIISLKAIL